MDEETERYKEEQKQAAETLARFQKNVYETLRLDHDKFLKETMLRKFGASTSGTQVPIVFNHAMGKIASSFPFLYLQGQYPSDVEYMQWEEKSSPYEKLPAWDEKQGMVAHPPFREAIKNLIKTWKDQNPVSMQEIFKFRKKQQELRQNVREKHEWKQELFPDEVGASILPLREKQLKEYLSRVDAAERIVDSALARLILQQTVLISPTYFETMLQASWGMFVKQFLILANKNPHLNLTFLLLPNKLGSDQWLATKLPLEEIKWSGILIAEESQSDLIIEPPWHPALQHVSGNETIHLIMIDDALYSGKQKLEEINIVLNRISNVSIVFHLVIPIVTRFAMDSINARIKKEDMKQKKRKSTKKFPRRIRLLLSNSSSK